MAVSADQLIYRSIGTKAKAPVAASTTLYGGSLAFWASGYADDDTNSGANAFAGIVIDRKDNSAGSAGDLTAELWTSGVFELTGSGFSQATVGAYIYASDNYTVTTSASGNTYVGRCVGYVSATRIEVQIDVISATASSNEAAFTTQVLTFDGATGINEVHLPDDLADALSVEIAGGATLFSITTTDSSESLDIAVETNFTAPLSLGDGTELTIASGVVTATMGYHKIDTESDGATDDLDTISGGIAGQILVVQAADGARSVVLKDGTGNLKLSGDLTLDNAEDTAVLLSDGTNWYEVAFTNNGA